MADDDSTTRPTDDVEPKITRWFRARLPEAWHPAQARVTVDREEVLVVLPLPGEQDPPEDDDERDGRVQRFRSETRAERMAVADEAQRRYGRTVSWGVRVGEDDVLFTTLAVPVMTRLRQPERLVLETLVEAGVARSRAHALAWCVRLVGQHSADWLADLRGALTAVERVRREGPDV